MPKKIMKLVKRADSNWSVTVPAAAHELLENTDYMECTIDGDGVHYRPMVV